MKSTVLRQVRRKLEQNGFSGLFVPGECGCTVKDLAPCGDCYTEEGEYINGCTPGYAHLDPRPGHVEVGDFVVTGNPLPPEGDEFDNYYE